MDKHCEKGKHMKRVMCLYRVSTKGQVDPQDDIPMQRRECQDFINRQSDWKFAGELMEKGVSGYKGNAEQFSEILSILHLNGYFQILSRISSKLPRKSPFSTPVSSPWPLSGAKRVEFTLYMPNEMLPYDLRERT